MTGDAALAIDVAQAGAILGLDHIGLFARDLAATAAAYARMGFMPTPLSRHSGTRAPGAPPEPFGTANHCLMFRDGGYVELMGIVDRAAYVGSFPEKLARYEGIHIIALATGDAAATAARFRAQGFAAPAPVTLSRPVEIAGRIETARFALARVAESEMPEARVFAIRHETPALVWQERWLDHANKAVALVDVLVCVPDLAAAKGRYARFLGSASRRTEDGREEYPLPRGFVSLIARDELATKIPGLTPPAVPSVVAMKLATADMDAARAALRAGDIPFRDTSLRLMVPASAAGGAVVVFESV